MSRFEGHTPEPWHLSKNRTFVRANIPGSLMGDGPKDIAIAEVHSEVDADLLTAAPALLAALKQAREAFVACFRLEEQVQPPRMSDVDRVERQARAALARIDEVLGPEPKPEVTK